MADSPKDNKPRGKHKKLVGKKVEWEYAHDPARGCFVATGIVADVQYNNIWFEDGDTRWIPDLRNLKVID